MHTVVRHVARIEILARRQRQTRGQRKREPDYGNEPLQHAPLSRNTTDDRPTDHDQRNSIVNWGRHYIMATINEKADEAPPVLGSDFRDRQNTYAIASTASRSL